MRYGDRTEYHKCLSSTPDFAKVKDPVFTERRLHDAFDDHRVCARREFLEVSPDRIVSALSFAEIENVTPNEYYVESLEDQVALNRARGRSGAFNFEIVIVPVGSILSFSRDPDVTCEVVDKKFVEFVNLRMSLSSSALLVLEGMGYQSKPVAGRKYWQYEGEPLAERRL